MPQLSAASKSKSLSVDAKILRKYFVIAQPLIVLIIIGLASFGIYQIFDIFQKASDVSNLADDNYSNYFSKTAVEKLRSIRDSQNSVIIPEGRTNPFQ